MSGIDPRAFEFAVSKIEDGFVFENFAQSFLSQILGYEFMPMGGKKDRGIDALEHTFYRKGYQRHIFQMSIDKRPEAKIVDTLDKLFKNKIKFDSLTLVTNRVFPDKDKAVDKLFETYQKVIRIYDIKWLTGYANHSEGTVNTYHAFVDSYLHEFNQPGKSYVVSNLIADPRLFVFLRQQWESNRRELELDKLLVDSLILFSLEGTDPDKGIFRTQEEIKQSIANHIKYDPKLLYGLIEERLAVLSARPRRIQFHNQAKAFCLPYKTRLEIQEKNLDDAALYEDFKKAVGAKLKSYLSGTGIVVKDCVALIESTINRLFHQQGLEFADFVLHGDTQKAFEKDLPDIISAVVDESSVVPKNRNSVKTSLLLTIRDIVYNGTSEQKMFLKRLSNTYMMLFLLQCDPKLATYFHSLAAKLKVYVCTSIIIPALSEFYLDGFNRRHWNLLKGSRIAGVKLIVNETIIHELVSHFRRILNRYREDYENNEEFYLSDEITTLYIDEILIRAYFYAKRRKQVATFYDFIDNFVNPNLSNAETNLADWLKEEFGMQFVSDASLGVHTNRHEESVLTQALAREKGSLDKAKNDAKLILTIYAQRTLRNEVSSDSIWGYRTWWLSKDTLTQKTVNKVFKDKYKISCYMRPDFLYNYVSLAPSRIEVDAAYSELFPSLLGVNISSHLPKEVTDLVHQRIAEHSTKNPARLRAILRDLAEKLKSDPTSHSRQYVEHYLDSKLRRVTGRLR